MANRRTIIGNQDTGAFLEVDAMLSFTPTLEAEITDNPVERGANVSDHKRRKPDALALDGIFSNTPAVDELSLSPGFSMRVQDAKKFLTGLLDGSALCSIYNDRDQFENMALSSLTFPRDPKTGDSLSFKASFKQIFIVNNQTVAVVTKKANGQKKVEKGKEATKPATKKETLQSMAALLNSKTGSGGATDDTAVKAALDAAAGFLGVK